jgi:predicted  nucleic acid-binding Zn-ribbon protein
MTSENRLLFDFTDILSVQFRCKKCGFVFSVDPDNWKRLPNTCSNCSEQWFLNSSPEEETLQTFRKALEDLRKMENDRFSIRLELKGPL